MGLVRKAIERVLRIDIRGGMMRVYEGVVTVIVLLAAL
jgi:hypothetical protein